MYNSSLDKWKQLWLPMPDPGPAPSSAGVQVNYDVDVDVDYEDDDVNADYIRMMKRPDPGQAPSNTDFLVFRICLFFGQVLVSSASSFSRLCALTLVLC